MQTRSARRAPSSSWHPGRDRQLRPALQKAKGKAPSCLLRRGGHGSEIQQGVNRTLPRRSQTLSIGRSDLSALPPPPAPRGLRLKPANKGGGGWAFRAWTCPGGPLPQPGALAASFGSLSPQQVPFWTQGQGRPPPDGHCSHMQLMSSVLSWKVTLCHSNLRNGNR